MIKSVGECRDSLGPVHTTLEEFENGGFTLKKYQTFSVHTTPEESKNATITGQFEFAFEKTQAGKSHDYRGVIVFKTFFVHTKTNSRRSEIPPV